MEGWMDRWTNERSGDGSPLVMQTFQMVSFPIQLVTDSDTRELDQNLDNIKRRNKFVRKGGVFM